jgi:hypothetical protein
MVGAALFIVLWPWLFRHAAELADAAAGGLLGSGSVFRRPAARLIAASHTDIGLRPRSIAGSASRMLEPYETRFVERRVKRFDQRKGPRASLIAANTGTSPTATMTSAGSAATSKRDSLVASQTAIASVSPPSGRSSAVAGNS